MLDICRVLQNLLPTLRSELTVHPFEISPQNPQKIELAMLMQCLFAIGRQRVPQFLSNASNHLCHCIFDVTLSVCHSIWSKNDVCARTHCMCAYAWKLPCATTFLTCNPHHEKKSHCEKNQKIELIMHLQCLFAIEKPRVPLLLRNTSKPRVPLHVQCHLIACAASSSSNSRLFSIPAPRNPTVPALITFQEIKTGTRPYIHMYIYIYIYIYMRG